MAIPDNSEDDTDSSTDYRIDEGSYHEPECATKTDEETQAEAHEIQKRKESAIMKGILK